MDMSPGRNSIVPAAGDGRLAGHAGQRGVSLIGVLLAVLILATAAVAITQLMARTQDIAAVSRERFRAANLAREGLELIAAHRDSNWFLMRSDGRHWTDGLCDPAGDESFTGAQEVTIDPEMARRLETGSTDEDELFVGEAGEWSHVRTEQPTGFRRRILIDCANKNGEQNESGLFSITLRSTVEWQHRGEPRQVVLQEVLYDWLRQELTEAP